MICRCYFVAGREGPLAILRGQHVHHLSLGLSCLVQEYLEYGMHSSFSTGVKRSGEQHRDPVITKLNIT